MERRREVSGLNAKLRRFWSDERGAEMVEWAVVTVILLVSTVWILVMIRESLLDMFRDVFEKISQDPPDTY
jgi:Flp pilus assembly pilin Flp